MEIILKQDYQALGYEGDLVKVKAGYARNYLIPRGIAIIATKANKRMLEELQKSLEKKRAKRIEDAKKVKERMEGVSIELTKKVSRGLKLYGSVSAQNIADELNSKGYEVLKKDVVLEHPIKEIGEYAVEVKVYKDVEAEVKVVIKKEGGDEEEAPVAEKSAETQVAEEEQPAVETPAEETAETEEKDE